MKKILFVISLIFLFQAQVFSVEKVVDLNLNSKNSYIFPINSRPIDVKSSNEFVVRVEPVTNFKEEDSSILITTLCEGISYISYKQKDKDILFRILVDDRAKEDATLIKLDKVTIPKPNTENKNI